MGVGGPVDYLINVDPHVAGAPDRLVELLADVGEWRILGGGSNVLAPDDGLHGALVRVETASAGTSPTAQGDLSFSAGASWDQVVDRLVSAGSSAAALLAGIPGSLGGAIYQNAGAFGSSLSSLVESVECIDLRSGDIYELDAASCEFGYRSSIFQQLDGHLIRSATLRPALVDPELAPDDLRGELAVPGRISTRIRSRRKKKDHVVDGTRRSAGSFFKNPPCGDEFDDVRLRFEELKAGFVEENAWVSSLSVGRSRDGTPDQYYAGSLVALGVLAAAGVGLAPHSVHGRVRIGASGANTFMNHGGATSEEILDLASLARGSVADQFSIDLASEVEVLR